MSTPRAGQGQTALVTGASGGIGYELAKLFAADGYDVVLVARSAGKLEEIAAEMRARHGVRVTVAAKDLSGADAPRDLHGDLAQAGVAVDVLVNNAGVGVYGPFLQSEWGRDYEMMQLNMVSLTALTKLFLRDMVARGRGRILNVASTAAFQPGPGMAVYYATKAYVLSFSEAVADEVRDKGITVTALCPGPTLSGFQGAAGMERSRLLFATMDSSRVAEIGYRALMAGRTVVIAGWLNKLLAHSVRLTPRAVVTRISRFLAAPS